MADFQCRAASFYVNGLKMAETYESTLTVTGGGEPAYGDNSEPNGGGLGYTFGVVESKLSTTQMMPWPQGSKLKLLPYVVQQLNVEVVMSLVDGTTVAARMRVLQAQVKSTHKNGMQEGSYEFGGFKPRLI